MFKTKLTLGAALVAAMLSGCQCDKTNVNTDGGAGGGGASVGGGSEGGGLGGGGVLTLPDGGPLPDPNDPLNSMKDSDCDGLTDAEEFGNTYANGKRTDPANPDSDGDGLLDGVELGRTTSVAGAACAFVGDADPASKTLPTEADSDADGLPDGLEDSNHDGKVDSSETNPTSIDSDGDALKDGDEDANHDGVVDPGETDPRRRDTDGDFINDGVEKNTTHTDPTKADTDGDTCNDGSEDFNQNGLKDPGETDPNNPGDCGPSVNPDSDNDGLPNAIELIAGTDPNNPDTDGDGLKDGIEDRNRNGVVDVGETDPLRKDTDCDGLIDGPDTAMYLGEDQNADGMRQSASETDPTRFDSDGDGISDGVERGVTAAKIPDATHCPNVPVDMDPTTTTNPNKLDTDGDGISDGAEDTNQNGRVDPGELNPNDPADGVGPAGKVCSVANLRPVVFKAEAAPDLQLALPSTFTEIATMVVGSARKGLIGYDATNQVAFVAWKQASPAGSTTPTADEAALITALNGTGAITNPQVRTFTTWDTLPAMQAFYDQAGGADLKVRANAIANAMAGAGAGSLPGTAGVTGPFKLQVEFVHRLNSATGVHNTVVVVALTTQTAFAAGGGSLFSMDDTAGGSATAQFGDANAVQCETFGPSAGKVDFLFVVDDSCSMGAQQGALANAATAVSMLLDNSALQWRVGLVTTSYHSQSMNAWLTNPYRRGFTSDITAFKSWLTVPVDAAGAPICDLAAQNGAATGCGAVPDGWVGINGSGDEGILGAARQAVKDLLPRSGPGATPQADKLRDGAQLVVVLLGDADDQTTGDRTVAKCTRTATAADPGTYDGCESIGDFQNFFRNLGGVNNGTGGVIPVHGIVCPQSGGWGRLQTMPNRYGYSSCGEDQARPQRHGAIINATGGIRGSISDLPNIASTINQIIYSTIAAAGYRPQKPPIGASIKVAMDDVRNPATCNKDDLPRSRLNGFDFNGVSRTISFYGECRPSLATRAAAVSYRYWIDVTSNPGGNPPPCQNDPYYDPNDPDFCKGRRSCDPATNTCTCASNCGGNAPAGQVCNPNLLVCDFVCTSDCGGSCNGYQTCNQTSCTCDCVQSATCALGYQFVSGGGVCGCVCDTASLHCGGTYAPDPSTCSCACKADCGGCSAGLTCNPSTCSCGSGIK